MPEVVERILVIIFLNSEKKSLECYWVHVQVLHQAQLIVHALQQGQHLKMYPISVILAMCSMHDLIMLPLPNIKLRSLESILGLLRENILVKTWNVSCMRWQRLSSNGWAVEVLW